MDIIPTNSSKYFLSCASFPLHHVMPPAAYYSSAPYSSAAARLSCCRARGPPEASQVAMRALRVEGRGAAVEIAEADGSGAEARGECITSVVPCSVSCSCAVTAGVHDSVAEACPSPSCSAALGRVAASAALAFVAGTDLMTMSSCRLCSSEMMASKEGRAVGSWLRHRLVSSTKAVGALLGNNLNLGLDLYPFDFERTQGGMHLYTSHIMTPKE
eukprot:CAMPEP_0202894954 /NCGR_PEP_ID=MMETSP1392-20130828/4248_1 /ASSEMBLY_ACC=CAM_ASM_000868 /TAXON_ID=225041 /ORGANISM="Chlamydomonas chlamydogama, Strain SAG 11-48b" /LENGTH=214 /DNA_ID=CAMNT_0049579813 /DNA_START=112 /DNA_END=756 /DNA_ORIENTATION=-